MAEGYLKKYLGEEFDVYSAGLDPKDAIHPDAVRAMAEAGIDISGQTPKNIQKFLGQHFTYLITVCSNAEARCPIFPGVIYRLFWPFEDPAEFEGSAETRLAKFRTVRDAIDLQIRKWMLDQKLRMMYPTATTP
jgi:arsenate reductase